MDKKPEWRPITEPPAFGSYDQPLSEPMLPANFSGVNLNAYKHQLTLTGWICVLLPWFFLIWKRIKWGLFDLLLLVASSGSSLGMALQTLETKKVKPLPTLGYLYLIVHVYAALFSCILYSQRFKYSWKRDSAWEKYGAKVLILGGVTLIVYLVTHIGRGRA